MGQVLLRDLFFLKKAINIPALANAFVYRSNLFNLLVTEAGFLVSGANRDVLMKNQRLARVIQILAAMQSSMKFTVDDLSKMFGVCRCTIFRDLEYLSKAGFKHNYHKSSRSYSLGKQRHIPSLGLEPDEALGLLMLVKYAVGHECLPFSGTASRAASKLERSLPEDLKKRCKQILKNTSFNAGRQCRPVCENVFYRLQTAICQERGVSIKYYQGNGHKIMPGRLQPHHLIFDNHKWYVIGNTRSRGKMLSIEITQIMSVDVLEKGFVRDRHFEIHKYLKGSSAIPVREIESNADKDVRERQPKASVSGLVGEKRSQGTKDLARQGIRLRIKNNFQ